METGLLNIISSARHIFLFIANTYLAIIMIVDSLLVSQLDIFVYDK